MDFSYTLANQLIQYVSKIDASNSSIGSYNLR